MAKSNNNTFEQVYNLSEEEGLLSKVAKVYCVLVERGLLVAGFSNKQELLSLNYSGYSKTKPVWELGFFEHLFANEPMLAHRGKVRGVFISGIKNLLVPDTLYNKDEAEKWLKAIHFIEPSDSIGHYPIKENNVKYLLAVPINITELVRINFKNAISLPLEIYQFGSLSKPGAVMQCFISAGQVSATLHLNGQLLWQKVTDYINTEDIAYTFMQVCTQNNITAPDLQVKCNSISAAEYPVIKGLSQYFPGIITGDNSAFTSSWDGAIKLAQQLYSCVS